MIRLLTSIDGPRSARMIATSLACVVTCVSFDAWAEPTEAERRLAAALFDQGRTLMTEGQIDEACIKLSESQRLDPGGGTLLNLALCHEKQGKIATAWTEFREARAIAKKDNRPDRESAADGEIAKLEPQLSKVSVVVAPDVKVPGMTVEIDSLPLPEAAWGTPFPVDPGPRMVVVNAPGYREWKTTVEIGTTAKNADVNIPKLEKNATGTPISTGTGKTDGSDTSNSSANATTPDKSAARTSTMRKAGFIIGGVGLGFIGIGAIAGGVAISKNNAVKDACPTTECSDRG
ncbi:MAG TPA: tetratricopeptide repeat protein, partial [Polyangium sp.]|nr:tetratricopeptide repeat protein [Polyangium sp.]